MSFNSLIAKVPMSLSGTRKQYSAQLEGETEEKEKNNSEINFSGKQKKKKKNYQTRTKF